MIKQMMIAPLLLMGTPQCEPQPQPKPDCEGAGTILRDFGDETPCDLNPPQVLIVLIYDMGPTEQYECDRSGGYIFSDGTEFLCYDLDY